MTSTDGIDALWQRLLGSRIARGLLYPLGLVYGGLGLLRNQAYGLGVLGRMRPCAHVISVGNLTVGGTGKTPVVIDLARSYLAQGKRVGILTRGYGRQDKRDSLVVAGGVAGGAVSIDALGDEPALILQAVPKAMIFVGSDRRQSALRAQDFGLNILILDDGFQHLALERDYDLVLYDINDDPRTAAVLPGGRLRESLSALRRAKALVFTKVDGADDPRIETYRYILQKYNPNLSFGAVSFAPSICRSASDETLDLLALRGRRIIAFSAIARHASFVETLRGLGADLVDTLDFGDHHWFIKSDLLTLQARAKHLSADLLVCTMKDMIKIRQFVEGDLVQNIFALDQQCKWHVLPEGLLA